MEEKIRKSARSFYWQNIYKSFKEGAGIRLFKNEENFTSLQVRFLYWLSVYDMLYEELTTLEDFRLTEKVIKDDMRTDAYLCYRKQKIEFERKKRQQEKSSQKVKNKCRSNLKTFDVKF